MEWACENISQDFRLPQTSRVPCGFANAERVSGGWAVIDIIKYKIIIK
jgi:hypothetical protein